MKSIELFAGAGGLALGLENAGFNHIGLIENDKDFASTLKNNRNNWNVICDDVEIVASRDLLKEFSIKKYELDLLSGGPPCQPFSYAGYQQGLDDVRGNAFYDYALFIDKLQPKMFLFENVKGLLTHDKGSVFSVVTNLFKSKGYQILFNVLNAWDYGVPQKRERLLIVGIRNDLVNKISFSFPKPQDYKPVLKDIILDINPSNEECVKYSEYKVNIIKNVPPGGCWRDIDPAVAKVYMKNCWHAPGGKTGILRRLSLDEPSLTVLTSPYMKQTDRCHPIEIRPFSYRENARIQTFPECWKFSGNIKKKYKQIGNAVPVNMAKEIGMEISRSLHYINN